jgi:hypothetical protein
MRPELYGLAIYRFGGEFHVTRMTARVVFSVGSAPSTNSTPAASRARWIVAQDRRSNFPSLEFRDGRVAKPRFAREPNLRPTEQLSRGLYLLTGDHLRAFPNMRRSASRLRTSATPKQPTARRHPDGRCERRNGAGRLGRHLSALPQPDAFPGRDPSSPVAFALSFTPGSLPLMNSTLATSRAR